MGGLVLSGQHPTTGERHTTRLMIRNIISRMMSTITSTTISTTRSSTPTRFASYRLSTSAANVATVPASRIAFFSLVPVTVRMP